MEQMLTLGNLGGGDTGVLCTVLEIFLWVWKYFSIKKVKKIQV